MTGSKPAAPSPFHTPLVALSDALRRKKLIVVVGAGASISAGLPSWNELVAPMRPELGLPKESEKQDPRLLDPLYVAEMYEQKLGRASLLRKVLDSIGRVTTPSEVHKALARLDVHTIFTTNYDDLMERALEAQGKDYHVTYRDGAYAYTPSSAQTTVIKLHGDIKDPSELVLTKSEVFRYRATHPNLLEEFKGSLKKNTALFIGTSMIDPNLEAMFELSLMDLPRNAVRHYILVKDWNENLKLYYERHYLVPVPLSNWSEAVEFLDELNRRAGVSPAEQLSPISGTPTDYIAVKQETFQGLLAQADKGLAEEYNHIVDLYRKGAREAVKANLESMWKRLTVLEEDRFSPLKVKVLVLLAQITASTGDIPDFSKARSYLEEAEALGEESNRDHIRLARALCTHLEGETEAALRELENVPGEPAKRLRFELLLGGRRSEEAAGMVPEIASRAKDDEDCARLAAKYYVLTDRIEPAKEVLDPWIDGATDNPVLFETTGYIYAKSATRRREEFCTKYNLFPYFSFVLFHEQLLDCGEGSDGCRSAKCFEEAAGLYLQMGEKLRALDCYKGAYAVRHMCHAGQEELNGIADKMASLSDGLPVQTLSGLLGDKPLLELESVDFENALQVSFAIPYVLDRLVQWATETGRAAWAATFLERNDVQETIDTVELQAFAVTLRVILWEAAGEPEKALDAIDSFVPPVEYSYFPRLLRARHYISQRQNDIASLELAALAESYGNNPMVLAQLCEWHELKSEWGKMEESGQELINLIAVPQTYEYYLTALGAQKKWEAFLECLERAGRAGVKLGADWTLVNRARALIGLDRFEEALKVYRRAEELEGTEGNVGLKSQDKLHMIRAFALVGHGQEAFLRAQSLKLEYPDHAEAHLLLVQLLSDQDRVGDALEVASKAANSFTDNEEIQAVFIQTAIMAGQTHDIADTIAAFREKFPASNLLRTVPAAALPEILEGVRRIEVQAEELYVRGRLPALSRALMPGSAASYFRFWQTRAKYRLGLYVACGEQAEEWTKLDNPKNRESGAVMDYSALLTAFELQQKGGKWV
ncbi:MAG: SIR2 family protein, partial [Pseudomonadota bacterium]